MNGYNQIINECKRIDTDSIHNMQLFSESMMECRMKAENKLKTDLAFQYNKLFRNND